jgi:hypothetical protein
LSELNFQFSSGHRHAADTSCHTLRIFLGHRHRVARRIDTSSQPCGQERRS